MLVIILSMIHQFFDEPPFIVNSHRLFFISYFLVFISLFKRKILEKSPFLLVFLFLITLVVNQRLAVLSVDTKYSLRLDRVDLSVDLVSSYIFVFFLYLALLTLIVFCLGIVLKKNIHSDWMSDVSYRGARLNVLVFLFLLAACWEVYNLASGGYLGGQSLAARSFLDRYFFSLLRPDVFFYMALGFYLTATQNFKQKYLSNVLFLISAFMVWKLFSGSKDGLLMLAIYLFSIQTLLGLKDKIRVSVGGAGFTLFLAVSAIGSFLYIDIFRVLFWGGGSIGDITDLSSRLDNQELIRSTIGTLSNRLAIFDESMFSLYLTELGYSSIDHIVNLQSTGKLILEVIVPGTLFEDLIKPQYALAIAQGIASEQNANGVFVMTGFVWGFVGFFGHLFGNSIGPFFAAYWFLFGIIYFIFLGKYVFPRTLGFFFLAYHMPVWVYLFLSLMGLGHSASWFVHIPILNMINYLIYVFIFSFALRIKKTMGQ